MWFLSLKVVATGLWAASHVAAGQIPFKLPSSDVEGAVHYSSVDQDRLPIALGQYADDVVVRVDYTGNIDARRMVMKFPGAQVWSASATKNLIDVQVPRDALQKLQTSNIKFEVIIEDLAQKVFETYPDNHKDNINADAQSGFKYKATEEVVKETRANIMSEIFFKEYRPLETIDAWLDLLQESFPDLVTIETIGETFEKRPYKLVHLSRKDQDHSAKKTVVMTGGVHAREWIAVSSVCYQIYASLNYYLTYPDQNYLDQLDFLFIPVLNPDGYDYTWNQDRLWRKNRQDTKEAQCKGVDIDHSYDYHWTPSSEWACGEEYAGEKPFEAVEAQIWADYLNKTNGDHQIYGYIDLHSYSQEVLYPYAYSCESEPRDEENLIELAYGISKAIRLQSGKTYNVLPACLDKDSDFIPDLGAGTALDFMYHNKAFWAYQLKLRDSGSHGFLLPSKYIEPVGEEIFAGLQYFCRFILQEY